MAKTTEELLRDYSLETFGVVLFKTVEDLIESHRMTRKTAAEALGYKGAYQQAQRIIAEYAHLEETHVSWAELREMSIGEIVERLTKNSQRD